MKVILEDKIFTRIHTLKFPNKLSKETFRENLIKRVDEFFKENLFLTQFVDIDDTTLFFINLWESEQHSNKVNFRNKDLFEQMKEMGIKISITGGKSICRYSDNNVMNNFKKIN